VLQFIISQDLCSADCNFLCLFKNSYLSKKKVERNEDRFHYFFSAVALYNLDPVQDFLCIL